MTIAENVARVREEINLAAQRCGRNSEDITLVAASKMNGFTHVREAIEAGITVCGENRVQEISQITRNFKIMAKELGIPVVVLSQLARGSEKRTDHRPVLSDLRDSGSIEQDADIVLFLYRDDYYQNENPDVEQDRSSCECIVAKNRHGETRTVPLHWQGEFLRFTSREVFRDEEG